MHQKTIVLPDVFGRRLSGIVCFMVLLCWTGAAAGQNGLLLNVNFLTGVPRGDFESYVGNPSWGGSFSAGWRLPDKPLILGADFNILQYGKEKRREILSSTIPDLPVRVTNSNNMLRGHLFLRLQPERGRIRPYCEGLLGFNYIFTRTSARGDHLDESIGSTNFSDWALSSGIGGGAMIRIHDFRKGDVNKKGFCSLFIDLNVRYLFGSEAEYIREGGIRRIGDSVVYDVSKSGIDMLLFRVGASVMFGGF